MLESPKWFGQFDGVIANGSLEHWVQPDDVIAGRMEEIYKKSFSIAHRMIDPKTRGGRYVTTALQVESEISAEDLMTPWQQLPRGSDRRMFSHLHTWFGGYYPVFGKLQKCASPFFHLDAETDGTLGYKIASDYLMAMMKRGLYSSPRLLWGIAKALARHPRATASLLHCYFIEEAWDWQFRGDIPPTKLLRQTWKINRN